MNQLSFRKKMSLFLVPLLLELVLISGWAIKQNYEHWQKIPGEVNVLKNSVMYLEQIGIPLTIFFVITALIMALSFKIIQDISKKLNTLSTGLTQAATITASLSTGMSSSSSDLASGVSTQSAALQETVSSLEEVRAMVSKNAENAEQAKQVAQASSKNTKKGKDTVLDLISAIKEISQSNEAIQGQVETSNNEMTEITRVIGEIASKTKVINEIVFQTKLLSFNASVEAARAGENGKGFAVVAEEVGNLAQMSGRAAKEISQLLEVSINKVEAIVKNSKSKVSSLIVTSKEKVEIGTTTANRCDAVLDGVLKDVDDMNLMIIEIATASKEQSQGVDEISKAMNQLEIVTQANNSASHQLAALASDLNKNARKMEEQAIDLAKVTSGSSVNNFSKTPTVPLAKEITPAPIQNMPAENEVPIPVKEISADILSLENVRELKKSKEVIVTTTHINKAMGAENPPSANDPRFEEV